MLFIRAQIHNLKKEVNEMYKNVYVNERVEQMANMTQPDKIVWLDGSEEEKARLTAEAVATGELVELNQQEYPGCLYHRTAENDVARVEHLTFICTEHKEDAGPTNNWEAPAVMYEKLNKLFKDSYKGRTMYVIPYMMGPYGSPFSKIGIELTDSRYVVLNMEIMTRVGTKVMEVEGAKMDTSISSSDSSPLFSVTLSAISFPISAKS